MPRNLGHHVVAADGRVTNRGLGPIQEAQAAHLRDLGEFDGVARQERLSNQDAAAALGLDRGGDARRVGLVRAPIPCTDESPRGDVR